MAGQEVHRGADERRKLRGCFAVGDGIAPGATVNRFEDDRQVSFRSPDGRADRRAARGVGDLVPVIELDNLSSENEEEILEALEKGPIVVEVEFTSRYPGPAGPLQDPRYIRRRPEKEPEDALLPDQYAP